MNKELHNTENDKAVIKTDNCFIKENYTLTVDPKVLAVMEFIVRTLPVDDYANVVHVLSQLAPAVWPYSKRTNEVLVRLTPPPITQ